MNGVLKWIKRLLGQRSSFPGILGEAHDQIFQGIAESDPQEARTWSAKLALAVQSKSDASLVWPQFAYWLLSNLGCRSMSMPLDEEYLNQQQIVHDSAEIFWQWVKGSPPTRDELLAASLRTTTALQGLTTSDMACAVAGYALDGNPIAIKHAAEQVRLSKMEFSASLGSYQARVLEYGNEARRKHYLEMADRLLQIVSGDDPSLACQ